MQSTTNLDFFQLLNQMPNSNIITNLSTPLMFEAFAIPVISLLFITPEYINAIP